MLRLYRCLVRGEKISQWEYIHECQITERTFDRDIADLRAFLQNEFIDLNLYYDASSNTYALDQTNEEQQPLDEASCYLLCEFLRHSSTVSESERERLTQIILSQLPLSSQEYLYKLLERDGQNQGIDSDNPKTALKLVGDLLWSIRSEKEVTLHFCNGRDDERCAPYTMALDLTNAVLLAWGIDEHCPKCYPLSDIHSFTIGGEYHLMRSEVQKLEDFSQKIRQMERREVNKREHIGK